MTAFPAEVIDFLIRRSIEHRSAAYLVFDQDNNLLASGGQLTAYGLGKLPAGENAGSSAYFLEGILPLQSRELVLNCLETKSGLMADIHFFRKEQQTYVVLLEAMLSPLQQRQVQQQNYELQLDQERRAKLLEQQIGRDQQPSGIAEEALLSDEGGRRTVTILSVMIKDSGVFLESAAPGRFFTVVGKIFDLVIQSINAYGGMIDRINRNSINAIFGFGDSRLHPTQHAISAGEKILKSLQEEKKQHPLINHFPAAAAGVTSGVVTIGTLHINQRKILSVYGDVVDMAEQLAASAGQHQILLDQDSYAQSQVHAPKFAEAEAGPASRIYRWQL